MTLLEVPITKRSGVDGGPGRRPLANRLVAAMPILAAIMTMLVFAPFAPLGIHGDVDLMLKPAMDVLYGQALFRDTMSWYGPLNTYIQAGFLALLGPKLIWLRIGTVVMYGLAGGFLVAAWGRLLPPILTALSLLLWWSLAHFLDGSPMHPWLSVNNLMFQAAALFFSWSRPRPLAMFPDVPPALRGSAGLCFWSRFHIGLPLIAVLGISYLILACRRWRAAAGVATAASIPRWKHRGPPRLRGSLSLHGRHVRLNQQNLIMVRPIARACLPPSGASSSA